MTERIVPVPKEPQRVWVIMANDFPHMVKSTKQKAKRWVDHANKTEQDFRSGANALGRPRIHYRFYGAVIDGGVIQ